MKTLCDLYKTDINHKLQTDSINKCLTMPNITVIFTVLKKDQFEN